MARRQRQVREREAAGEVERIYYEAREVLRVTGVDVTLRAWAEHGRFLVALWEALGPNLETRAFEEAADAVREEALDVAAASAPLEVWDAARLGESQRFHVRGVVELYQSLLPKLLVLASAVRQALVGEPVGQGLVPGSAERMERGAPRRMAAMEWAPELAGEARVRAVWDEVRWVLGPPGVPGEWRALGLWPDFLVPAWERLKVRARSEDFTRAADALRLGARRRARVLPYTVALSRERVEGLGEDAAEVLRVTEALERRLPAQVLAVALLAWDGLAWGVERRPFPAPARLESDWAMVGELQ
jgi:hypothetical protein